jgi:hypothetical protein
MKFSVDFRPEKFRSKDLWREAQNKLSKALEDRTQTGDKYEKWTKHAPLSLFALDMNPRLKLLAVTLQKLEDKARFTSIILLLIYFTEDFELFSNYLTVVACSGDFSCSEIIFHLSAMTMRKNECAQI